MKKILFVSNALRQCGVYQFGKSIYSAISFSREYQFDYVECGKDCGDKALIDALHQYSPDVVIYNWYPATMPWLTDDLYYQIYLRKPSLIHLTLVHDFPMPYHWIDGYIHIDPSFREKESHFRIGRLIPDFIQRIEPPDNIIGSFGFGFKHKNFDRIVRQVNQEYDAAVIRLHLPFSSYGDPNGMQARQIVDECKKICKPGVSIEANHNFLDDDALLYWLSQNSVNCFFFDKCYGAGISSSIDWALAVKRPIAITDSYMFKHISKATPSILIEKSSLKEIIQNGLQPLEPFYQQWTKKNLIADFDRIIKSVISERDAVVDMQSVKGSSICLKRKFSRNRFSITDDPNQIINLRKSLVVEQAHAYAEKTAKILVIEKNRTFSSSLEALGFKVSSLYPHYDLDSVCTQSKLFNKYYDLIICCVEFDFQYDNQFIVSQIYEILKPGGLALLSILSSHFRSGNIESLSEDCRLEIAAKLVFLRAQLSESAVIEAANYGEVIGHSKCAFFCLAFQKINCHSVERRLSYEDYFKQYAEKKCLEILSCSQHISNLNNHIENCLHKKIADLSNQLNGHSLFHLVKYRIFRKLRIILGKFPKIYSVLRKGKRALLKFYLFRL